MSDLSSEDKYTLPVASALNTTGQDATDYGLLLAGSVLVVDPIVPLFFCRQRCFTQSIVAIGVK